MPQTSAEKTRKYRERLKASGKYKDALKKDLERKKRKAESQSDQEKKKMREKNKVACAKYKSKKKESKRVEIGAKSGSPYGCKSALGKDMSRLKQSLPKSPRKASKVNND